MNARPITNYVLTPHASFEMDRRRISKELLDRIMKEPEQRLEVRPGREVLQSRIRMGRPEKAFLVRIFVDVERRPAEVVTVYRTTKISKYLKGNP